MGTIRHMYEDPVIRHQDDTMAFRYFIAVGGKNGKSYTFNFGEDLAAKPFAHEVPCGYEPIANLINVHVDSDAPFTPPATENCWTCKGTCSDYDPTPDNVGWAERSGLPEAEWLPVPPGVTVGVGKCNRYADGTDTGSFDYKKHGMTGLKFSKDVLPAQNINTRPQSCELEMDRDCPAGPTYNSCQAWQDGVKLAGYVRAKRVFSPTLGWYNREASSDHYTLCQGGGAKPETDVRLGEKITVDGVDHW